MCMWTIRGRGHRGPFGVAATIRGRRLKVEAWVSGEFEGGIYLRAASDRGNTVFAM